MFCFYRYINCPSDTTQGVWCFGAPSHWKVRGVKGAVCRMLSSGGTDVADMESNVHKYIIIISA